MQFESSCPETNSFPEGSTQTAATALPLEYKKIYRKYTFDSKIINF
jgi:hypothetical protein